MLWYKVEWFIIIIMEIFDGWLEIFDVFYNVIFNGGEEERFDVFNNRIFREEFISI